MHSWAAGPWGSYPSRATHLTSRPISRPRQTTPIIRTRSA
jgi:hypothetical protein